MVRLILAGVLLMVFLPLSAFAGPSCTAALPGEGDRVTLPARYEAIPEGDYRWHDTGGVIAYRRYRSMASGTDECDGMIAVARSDAHESLDAFVNASRAALTTRWASQTRQKGAGMVKRIRAFPLNAGPAPPARSFQARSRCTWSGFSMFMTNPAGSMRSSMRPA
jgi:hypothetical protein